MRPWLERMMSAVLALALAILTFAVSPHANTVAGPSPCEVANIVPLYDLNLHKTIYHVVDVPRTADKRGRRAFIKENVLVQDLGLARQLAVAAWVKENLIDGRGPLPYTSPREQLIATRQTFIEIRRYVAAQDIVAAAWVAAPTIALRGIQSATRVIVNVTWDMVRDRVFSLDALLTNVAYRGVSDAIVHYEKVDLKLRTVAQTILDVEVGREIYENYVLGLTYERTSRSLMVALMPKKDLDLVLRALRGVGRTAAQQFPKGPTEVGLRDVARARERVDDALSREKTLSSLPAVRQYLEDYKSALRFVTSIGEWIEGWAAGATTACEALTSTTGLTPSAPPSAAQPQVQQSPSPGTAVSGYTGVREINREAARKKILGCLESEARVPSTWEPGFALGKWPFLIMHGSFGPAIRSTDIVGDVLIAVHKEQILRILEKWGFKWRRASGGDLVTNLEGLTMPSNFAKNLVHQKDEGGNRTSVLSLAEKVDVKVTGILREGSRAAVEARARWTGNQAAKFVRDLGIDLNIGVSIANRNIPHLAWRVTDRPTDKWVPVVAIYLLYDDGWRLSCNSIRH